MNVTSVLTKDYERNDIFAVPENKPNSNPIYPYRRGIKPISKAAPGMVSLPVLSLSKGSNRSFTEQGPNY